jgi:hypothetical protein
MAISAASGFPQNSGILIPEIWSGKTLVEFYTATVASAISNTDYEGEISKEGDKVHIRTLPDIEIHDYVKGAPLLIQNPNPGKIELLIDRSMYFNLSIDSIDRFQSDLDFLGDWTRHAGTKLGIEQDRRFLGSVYADAHAKNKGATAGKISGNINLGVSGTPLAVDKTTIVDLLVDCGVVLDEQDVPSENRKIVLPAWAVALIKKSELKDASLTGDGQSTLRNGRAGMVDRWEVFMSNNLTHAADGGNEAYHAIACHSSAITFAAQMTENRTFQAEATFGWFARSLVVYGHKVIKPEGLIDLYIRKG